jgi:hypothetical protein
MHIIEDRNDANDILHRSQPMHGRGIFLLSLIGLSFKGLILLSQSYISKFARAGQFEEKEALLTCFF